MKNLAKTDAGRSREILSSESWMLIIGFLVSILEILSIMFYNIRGRIM